jgi:SAM-dependent methyltransferase
MNTQTNPAPVDFDRYVEDYEEACGRGLALAGESRDYFARQRVAHTRRRCPRDLTVRNVVDFGCGLGHTVPYLLESFPGASALGVDPAAETARSAQARYGSDRVGFSSDVEGLGEGFADLVYCNGVFHHIDPKDRDRAARNVFRWLRPGGVFALWENNPWNPGTRLVMRRIPFDRDAITLSYLEGKALVRRAGFRSADASFHFFFPSALRLLRPLEPRFEGIPLGAQYCVLARKAG